jgi:hypothetical protein
MLKIKCPKHPKYNGSRSPHASCEACQAIWKARQDCLMAGAQLAPVTVVYEPQQKLDRLVVDCADTDFNRHLLGQAVQKARQIVNEPPVHP